MKLTGRFWRWLGRIGRTRKIVNGVLPKLTFQSLMLGVCFLIVMSVMVFLSLLQQFTFMHQTPAERPPEPFPISVYPNQKEIVEITDIERYLRDEFSVQSVQSMDVSWWQRLIRKIARSHIYQQTAAPLTRTVVIWPGDRKEQIAEHFGEVLRWSDLERDIFLDRVSSEPIELTDGTFFPGRYHFHKDTGPETAAREVIERFTREVYERFDASIETHISLEEALILASLLEREADDFQQMREISGIIWNRRFNDMKLQLDATLQYIKGSDPSVPLWWPRVVPDDKFLDSPYNTYQYEGIPPAPIANPSATTILAVLNPIETDCFFYFHTDNGTFYCSRSYEEHRQKLINIYGQGR